MNSYVTKEFKKGFLLSPENIIKLNDLISKRLVERNCPKEVTFKIVRSDALAYTTTNHALIIDEENSKRNLIHTLTLSCDNDVLKFQLTFDKSSNTKLIIESTDKDFTYLLLSDIKDYLSLEPLNSPPYQSPVH